MNNLFFQKVDYLITDLDNTLICEAHVVAELYYKLRSSDLNLSPCDIRLEHPYDFQAQKKCDIYISSKIPIWIEVKGYFINETSSTRARKHTKKESSPFRDVEKLCYLDGNNIKILYIYQNVIYNPTRDNSWENISKKCEEGGIVFKRLVKL